MCVLVEVRAIIVIISRHCGDDDDNDYYNNYNNNKLDDALLTDDSSRAFTIHDHCNRRSNRNDTRDSALYYIRMLSVCIVVTGNVRETCE